MDHILLLEENLIAPGDIVDKFTDHFKAILVFEKNPDRYNVVIVNLESTSNHELKEIKNMNKNVKIVGITASEIELKGMEIDAILKKPFHIDLLMSIVRKFAMPTVTSSNTYSL